LFGVNLLVAGSWYLVATYSTAAVSRILKSKSHAFAAGSWLVGPHLEATI